MLMHSNKLFCKECYARIELAWSLYHKNLCEKHWEEYQKNKPTETPKKTKK